MSDSHRVVFDCNIYFQALIAPDGPAGQALLAAESGRLTLYTSRIVTAELRDVCMRPHLARRFRLRTAQIEGFIELIESFAVVLDDVRHVFDYPRDPDDAHYVDLAVAANVSLIVSRDKDLLVLQDPSTPEGLNFKARFVNRRHQVEYQYVGTPPPILCEKSQNFFKAHGPVPSNPKPDLLTRLPV